MGILLLVFFIVPEADFQHSWYKHIVVLEEFMIDYVFTVFWKSGTVRNLSPWILVTDWNLLLLWGQKSDVHF